MMAKGKKGKAINKKPMRGLGSVPLPSSKFKLDFWVKIADTSVVDIANNPIEMINNGFEIKNKRNQEKVLLCCDTLSDKQQWVKAIKTQLKDHQKQEVARRTHQQSKNSTSSPALLHKSSMSQRMDRSSPTGPSGGRFSGNGSSSPAISRSASVAIRPSATGRPFSPNNVSRRQRTPSAGKRSMDALSSSGEGERRGSGEFTHRGRNSRGANSTRGPPHNFRGGHSHSYSSSLPSSYNRMQEGNSQQSRGAYNTPISPSLLPDDIPPPPPDDGSSDWRSHQRNDDFFPPTMPSPIRWKNWLRFYDDHHRQSYFYDINTSRTSWSQPPGWKE